MFGRYKFKVHEDGRHFKHNLPKYNGESFDKILNDDIIKLFKSELLDLEADIIEYNSSRDNTIYTGTTGIALLFLNISITYGNENIKERDRYFELSKKFYEDSSKIYQKRGPSKRAISTFLEGDIGFQSLACVMTMKEGNIDGFKEIFQYILLLSNSYQDLSKTTDVKDISFELLYGICGYLQSLVFLRKTLPKIREYQQQQQPIDQITFSNIIDQLDMTMCEIVRYVVKSGVEYSKRYYNNISPLMFIWHNRDYLGGAHGVSGILYMLLESIDLIIQNGKLSRQDFTNEINLIQGTMEFVMSLQFDSGNFPSRKENDDDRLVQFCHGAPGALFALMKCYRFYGNQDKYLQSATKAADVVWKRGLLVKGVGLCHGVSGNAFAILSIFKYTKNLYHLHQVVEFVKCCCLDQFIEKLNTPDSLLSLFEDIGGLIWILNDLIHLKKNGLDNDAFINNHLNFPTY